MVWCGVVLGGGAGCAVKSVEKSIQHEYLVPIFMGSIITKVCNCCKIDYCDMACECETRSNNSQSEQILQQKGMDT